MAFHFLLVFVLLNIVFAGSHGAVPEEVYWKSVFPNNPMPKALKDILPPTDPSKEFNAPINLQGNHGNDELRVFYDWSSERSGNHENGEEPLEKSKDPSKEFKAPSSPNGYYGKGQSIKDYSDSINGHKDLSKEFKGKTNSLKGNQDVSLDSNLNNNFKVDNNIASIDETIFFFQKDLRPGKLMSLPSLIATSDQTPFLPDRVAKSIPFSSAKLPEILNYFSLKPQSREANTVIETIRGCERVAINGEEKFCATSFESFIDLSTSKLGKQIQLLSNELSKETKNPLFTIARGLQNMGENELVCHKMEYPGAVFLCHSINKTAVYKVPLVGRDGTKANALAVCHKDTSAWSPKHTAFQILKIKPGTVPICHFLARDTLVWVSN